MDNDNAHLSERIGKILERVYILERRCKDLENKVDSNDATTRTLHEVLEADFRKENRKNKMFSDEIHQKFNDLHKWRDEVSDGLASMITDVVTMQATHHKTNDTIADLVMKSDAAAKTLIGVGNIVDIIKAKNDQCMEAIQDVARQSLDFQMRQMGIQELSWINLIKIIHKEKFRVV